jgi:hypothetical protein
VIVFDELVRIIVIRVLEALFDFGSQCDLFPVGAIGGEATAPFDEVGARRWYEGYKLFDKLTIGELKVGRAI